MVSGGVRWYEVVPQRDVHAGLFVRPLGPWREPFAPLHLYFAERPPRRAEPNGSAVLPVAACQHLAQVVMAWDTSASHAHGLAGARSTDWRCLGGWGLGVGGSGLGFGG